MRELPPVPPKVQMAATVQVVSGLVNTLVMGIGVSVSLSLVSGALGGVVGTGLAVLGCPLGCLFGFSWLCGLWGLVLLPIGIFETVCGVAALLNPDGAGPWLRAATMAELASVAFGGIVSFGAGFVVLGILRDPEVRAFLEATPE